MYSIHNNPNKIPQENLKLNTTPSQKIKFSTKMKSPSEKDPSFTFPEPAIATTPLQGLTGEVDRRLRWELTLWKKDWVVEREMELSLGQEDRGKTELSWEREDVETIEAIANVVKPLFCYWLERNMWRLYFVDIWVFGGICNLYIIYIVLLLLNPSKLKYNENWLLPKTIIENRLL